MTGRLPAPFLRTTSFRPRDGSTLYGLTQAGGANDPKAVKKYGTVFAVTLNR